MKRTVFFSLIGSILVIGLVVGIVLYSNSPQEAGDDKAPEETSDLHQQEAIEALKEEVEVVQSDDGSIHANNLFIPWTINKQGSTFYLTQRDGNIVKIDGDFGLVDVQTVDVAKEIFNEGQGGFLGFTLAPDFEETNRALAYYTYKEDKRILNRIVSLTIDGNTWKEEKVLLDEIPGGLINTGGRIAIGPDGMLYATTGDTGEPSTAQDVDNLAGKILRMELDGSVPDDNPFEGSYVYSYGHRNSQGITWDEQGNMYNSEHGEDAHDEINLIEAGKNYGWPVIQGDEKEEDMVTPIYNSGEETWAPSGMAYNDGKLYVASLAGSEIFTYDIANKEISDFYEDAGRLRDVMIEENALFTITNNHDNRGEPSDKDDRLIHIPLTESVTGE